MHAVTGHVFISYSRADRGYVEKLATHLRTYGLEVWFDHEIAYGDRFESIIRERIDTCCAFVLVMTPDAEQSQWVEREIARAENMGKTMLPLLLEGQAFFRFGHVNNRDVRGGAMPGRDFTDRLRRLSFQFESAATPVPTDPVARRERTRLGVDAIIQVPVALEKTVSGGTETFVVESAIRCGQCSATGAFPGTRLRVCGRCGGSGVVQGGHCAQCQGYGDQFESPCGMCGGDGRVRMRRELSCRIPAGVQSGMRIHLAGAGEVGPCGGESGDLYVEVLEQPSGPFQRVADDLVRAFVVTEQQLRDGAEVDVPNIAGTVRMRIPPRSPDGVVVVARGHGVRHVGADGHGDLRVHFIAR